MIPPFLVVIFVFVLGALLGSFLNVCILRIPLSQSIVRPPHVVQLVVYNFQDGSTYLFSGISCFREGLGAVELIWILATPSLRQAQLAYLPFFGSSTHHNFSRPTAF